MVETHGARPDAAATTPELEATLRGVSDQFFLAVEALAQLERRKRSTVPAAEDFLPLSREVRVTAEEVLRIAADQERLAEQAHATPGDIEAIEGIRPLETLAAILAEWRAVERQLAAAPADSPEAAQLSARYAELRARYASALSRVRRTGEGGDEA